MQEKARASKQLPRTVSSSLTLDAFPSDHSLDWIAHSTTSVSKKDIQVPPHYPILRRVKFDTAYGQQIGASPSGVSRITDNILLVEKFFVFQQILGVQLQNSIKNTQEGDEYSRDVILRSGIVDPEDVEHFVKGFRAGFFGNFFEYACLLVLNLERCFRYFLNNQGIVTRVEEADGRENEKDLGTLLKIKSLKDDFGEDLIFAFEVLLTNQHGGNFRNRMCHSLMRPVDYDANWVMYLWALTLRLFKSASYGVIQADFLAEKVSFPAQRMLLLYDKQQEVLRREEMELQIEVATGDQPVPGTPIRTESMPLVPTIARSNRSECSATVHEYKRYVQPV